MIGGFSLNKLKPLQKANVTICLRNRRGRYELRF
ncbi:MAG: hypothetical protein ACI8UP_004378 [Porticoccaceae bacterium]|jgi:hypothetical protein